MKFLGVITSKDLVMPHMGVWFSPKFSSPNRYVVGQITGNPEDAYDYYVLDGANPFNIQDIVEQITYPQKAFNYSFDEMSYEDACKYTLLDLENHDNKYRWKLNDGRELIFTLDKLKDQLRKASSNEAIFA